MVFLGFAHSWHSRERFLCPECCLGHSPSMQTLLCLTFLNSLCGFAAGESLAKQYTELSSSYGHLLGLIMQVTIEYLETFLSAHVLRDCGVIPRKINVLRENNTDAKLV